MARSIHLSTILLATLAGAAPALAQATWEEEVITSGEDGEERRIEVRVLTQDDEETADEARPRQQRARGDRVLREKRSVRPGPGQAGQPRIMILDEDDQPREVRKPLKRKAQVREFRPDGREPVEIRIDGPRGPRGGGGGRGGEQDVIIRRFDGDGPHGPGPQMHRFDFPGGEGRVMIFKHGPDGAGEWRGHGGPEIREFRFEEGGPGPRVKVLRPGRGDGPVEVEGFRFERDDENVVIRGRGRGSEGHGKVFLHKIPDSADGDVLFRTMPGGPRGQMQFRMLPDGPGEERDIIIRRGGDDDAPRRVRIQRMDGSGGDPKPGSCPNCNCI